MSTWQQFSDAVLVRYALGTPNDNLLIRAVSEYVKGKIIKEVDHDLELSKSYLNDYALSRLAMAGYTTALTFAQVKTLVLIRITVDAARTSTASYVDKLIQEALDDIADLTVEWGNLLIEVAIELQRHIPTYCQRQENTYLSTTAGVTIDGLVSRFAPPGAKIRSVRHGLYYAPLAEGVAYIYGDIVTSNGRLYFCDEGGTLGAGQLGGGLVTITGEPEAIGALTFSYYGVANLMNGTPCHWAERDLLHGGQAAAGSYTISPQGDTLWFYPAIDADRRVVVEWDGLKKTFASGDTVAFDVTAQKAAAAYIRAKLAGAPLAEYFSALRMARIDAQEVELP